MSYHEYQTAVEIARRPSPVASGNVPFYSLIMAAMLQADSFNATRLRREFPDTWDELQRRYHAPGGVLPEEREEAGS